MSRKACVSCGEIKSNDEFYRNRKAKDGLQSSCKSCSSAYGKSYRSEHETEWAAKKAAYHQLNPHVQWESAYRTRATALGFSPVVERFTRAEVIAAHGDACFYCGGQFEQLDHYVPISRGGYHTVANVRPSCAACNYSKRNNTPEEMDSMK